MGWNCLISDAVLLQTGWPVGVGRGGRTDTGVGTVLIRMQCYFRLGGQFEFEAVGGRTRGLGLSHFRMRCYFRLGGQLEFDAVGGWTRGVGTASFRVRC